MFHLEVKGASALHRVVGFSGHEGISSLFAFTIDAAGPELDIAGVVGKPACLTIDGIDEPRHVHGFVSHIEHSGHSRRYRLYRLTLSPYLWRLQHRHDCRIFQLATTPEILKKVFAGAVLSGKEIRFELHAEYAPRDFCVQYRESDFNFVSRLMEEDGIFYFFEHDKAGSTLVISDHRGAHRPIPGIPVVAFNEGSQVRSLEHVTSMRHSEHMRPGKTSLRDFNFNSPEEAMEVAAQAGPDADLEVYDYPGEYQSPGDAGPHQGARMAQIRLEALQVDRQTGMGTSDCPRITPGHTFMLIGHPHRRIDGGYLVTQAIHRGSQPQVLDEDGHGEFRYANEFQTIAEQTCFRPPRVTARPIMRGIQPATVVGPGTEEVFTDEQGRVFIQFHWDRQGKLDGTSSCWVRVSQLWAGNGWGTMFIPRVGHEVLVDFIEGDPDRPIITGRVYHANNHIPYPLPDEKTKSTIRSESSPGGGGFNELCFEDRKGGEQVFIHAQRNMDTCVRNDSIMTVLHDKHLTVGAVTDDGKVGDFCENVLRDRHITVNRDQEQQIGGSIRLHIGGIDGAGESDLVVEGVQRTTLRQTAHLHIEAERREHVESRYFLHVGDLHVLVDGNLHIKGPKLVVEATDALSLQGGGSFVHLDSSGVAFEGPTIWMNSGKSTIVGTMDPATIVEDAREARPKLPDAADGLARTFLDVRLVNLQGDPIPNLPVKVRVGSEEHAVTTDGNGRIRLPDVDPGLARLEFDDHFPIKRIKRDE
jgi:type VI secretion system secreted protein VgrG